MFGQSPLRYTSPISLTYCVDPDWMPYEAIRVGKHVGLSADYIHLIGKYANIQFNLIETSSWDETLALLKSGDCQVASMLNPSPERESYLAFSKPFFNAENVFVTNSDIPFVAGYGSLQSKRLGLVRNYRHQEYVERYYPELNVTLVESESAGLLALSANEIDVLVGSMLSVARHIQKFGLNELKVSGLAKPHDLLSIGLIKSQTQHLERINTAIDLITESQHVDLFRRWNQMTVVDNTDYRFFYISGAALLLFIALMAWRNFYIVRFNRTLVVKNQLLEDLKVELVEKNTQLEFLSNRDALTSLYNRYFMVQRCEQEIARLNRFKENACLVLYDIDHFKQINDTHGHSLGDKILCELAQVVAREIRQIDIMARWGGEEFLILCPQTDLVAAKALSQRIQSALAKYSFDIIGKLTCSFGIAQYADNESFISWFDRADDAMYRGKKQGRNAIVTANSAPDIVE
ncbi:diguanylate cyclase [Aliiglaciecola litoralis]|uniref:diguanylate cyclase n=1 Tax=Aliiglaciecola litoralis TaxID=582857 RepID=A0ABP3WVZ7_9ALTE